MPDPRDPIAHLHERGPVVLVTERDLRDLRRTAIEGVAIGVAACVVLAAVVVLILNVGG